MPYLLPGKITIRKSALLSLFLALIFALAPGVRAQDAEVDASDSHDSHVRIVRISYIDGEVRMDSGHGWGNVTMNLPVIERTWLQTQSDGWAEVQFEDGSLLRLAPDTRVIFTELARSSSGGTVTTIDLDQGEAEFKVKKHDDGDFQVTVKNKTIALVNSGTFRVTSTTANPMEVVVFKGDVTVRDPESGDVIAVKKSETFALDPGDPGQYALDKGAEADQLDQWAKQRDDYLSTYGSAGSYSQSPYQYGTSDLNYYGQYYDLPGYGYVWQPTGVGLGWDPYSNGYWAYSPGFGYAWVSAYPWGWLPFRYGHWVFVNGRGWYWAPGEWNRWHTGPRWVNAPPSFRPPVRPTAAPTGTVTRAPGFGGAGVRGPVAKPDDRDRNRDNSAQAGGNRNNRRVLTNEDVQSRSPHSEVPPPAGPAQVERRPAVVDQRQQPEGGAGIHRGNEGRFRGDRETVAVPPVGRAIDRTPATVTTASPSQPVQQNNPPPQSYSPPHRQPENQAPPPQSYSPPPSRQPEHLAPPPAPQVHQSAPPPPGPAQQSAPAAASSRQSAPQESNSRQSDDGSRGRPR